jgi:hypothetical protein
LGVLICLISVDMVREVNGLVPMEMVADGTPGRKETGNGLVVVGDELGLTMLFVALVVMRRRAGSDEDNVFCSMNRKVEQQCRLL